MITDKYQPGVLEGCCRLFCLGPVLYSGGAQGTRGAQYTGTLAVGEPEAAKGSQSGSTC
jgi:hypothetical protein